MGRNKHLKKEVKEKIRELYKSGKEPKEINVILNLGERTIYTYIKDLIQEKKNSDIIKFKKHLRLLTIRDLSYIAGIIDGEGCFSIGKHHTHKKPELFPLLDITNTNIKLINYLQDVLPSNYIKHRENYGKNAKKSYTYRIYNPLKLELFLNKIIPFLILKKEQAKNMLEFIEMKDIKKRGKYYIKMKKLNRKGIK